MQKVDLCIEGGGLRGIAFAGSLAVLEENGYQPSHVAGTSAGAIVAALIAAGYRGVYNGEILQDWIARLLMESPNGPIITFKDLKTDSDDPRWRYKLQVVATDITSHKSIVFPRDAQAYGIHPDDLNVAIAVRMSMSIPFFFDPVLFHNKYIVDGGMLSNFPIWLFDSDELPEWPTFGLRLVDPDNGVPDKINGPFQTTMLKSLLKAAMSGQKIDHMENAHFARTIPILTGDISATDFDLTEDQIQFLYESGKKAATEFLEEWDFEDYKLYYRA
jgi:NTE family protein